MKRRVLSFIVALTLCVDLCPVWAFAADEGTDSGLCPHHPAHTDECGYVPGDPEAPCTFDCQACPVEEPAGGVSEDDSGRGQEQMDGSPAALGDDPGDTGGSTPTGRFTMIEDKSYPDPYDASSFSTFNTNGHTYTYEGTGPAIVVTGTGKLYLKGTVIAPNGSGIEVQSGGFLSITETEPGWETSITGNETNAYALNIASGAEVHLSTGTYSARGHAIQVEGDDLAALLEPGCAYFDGRGTLLLPADAVAAKVLVVGQCTGHSGEKTWAHTPGATTHSWTCPYCATVETEKCTIAFDENGTGACALCGNTVTIAVDESDLTGLVYDGTVKPESVRITVTLGDGTVLVKDTDYTVKHDPKKDAGEDTITVTGITFNGTFTRTYHVEQAQPGIRWDATTKAVDYNGAPVTSASLPHITITIPAPEDLHPYLQYSYRKTGETEFTAGLPTNAGTYEVKAYIPESQNYKEAETETLLALTINKIPAVATAPTSKTLTYNRQAQQLVTAGILKSGAIAEGAVIEYKVVQGSQVSPYSTEIPTGIDVSGYSVYYRVSGTENYTGVSETLVLNPDPNHQSARINHKEITPTVELSYYTTVYDGGDKEPTVTVKDGEDIIPKSEYTVTYTSNRDVGTANVKVTNKERGNYVVNEVSVNFEITLQPQAALTITQKPNTVIYGDTFTLGTQGGSGGGHVTWSVVSGQATVNPTSGQVKITGHGTITVKAVKSGTDPDTNQKNYEDAAASWEFEADLRPVTATVTAEDKDYGETYGGGDLKAAKVHAVVEQGVLPGDEITITGLTGTFSDENAGANKTVTVDTSGASIGGTNYEHYAVTYSGAPVKATIRKAVVHITPPPVAANLTYSGEAQELVTGAVVDTEGVSVEYALSESGLYDTAIPKGTNAGEYTVWYRVRETDNYTGLAAKSVDVTINKKQVAPVITLSGDGLTVAGDGACSYIYDGSAKEPTVTLTEADGTIPADQYTVKYTANTNVGNATVTVTAKADGNYTFTNAPVTKTFEIKKEQAKVLAAPEAAGDPLTFGNRALKLVTAGTAYGGTMVYWVDDGVTAVANAVFSDQIPTRTDAKDYKVYYKVAGDGNHSDSDVGSVTVTIAPKTVTATIELSDPSDAQFTADGSYTYDGNAKEPTVIVKDGSTVIAADEYNLIYRNNIDAGDATVSITAKAGGNYTVTGSTTFVIQKANIVFSVNPTDANVIYSGRPQELLKEGTFEGGTVQYALGSRTSTYGDAIPTATNAGTYTVWYRVIGDKNHNDFAATSVTATIQRKPLTAITIELSPTGFAYDGGVKLPAVAVKDGNTVLPEGEYDWSCNVDAPTTVGTYTITISDAANGNYDLTNASPKTATFTIGKVPQDALVIGGRPAATNYGDRFTLTVTGGSGTGAVTWTKTGPATVDDDGNVTITGVGEVTITVEKAADTNYLAAEAEWSFTAAPRPVDASITVADKDYDGNTSAVVSTASIAVISGDTVIIDPNSITAVFDTPAVGTGKTVTLDASKVKVTGDDAGKYDIRYPDTVTADITQADTEITTHPAKIDPLTYNGQPQALVTAGKSSVGFIVYSLDGNSFSPEIPTGTNAGTYSVYYKVDGTADYTGVAVNETPITVTIAPKSITPDIEVKESSYLYDGTKKDPAITVKDDETEIDRKQYKVTWKDESGQTVTELKDAGTYTAAVENVAGGNYTFSKTVTVEIVAADQGSVDITGMPEHVRYGDRITTLRTSGGVGNGTVKWTLSGGTKSTINENTGVLEVKDTGELTVKVERAVDNYKTVNDTWTFTVEPKPVTAEVTVADKVYDGNKTATVTKAEAKASDLVNEGDTITITGLKGTFDDVNAGSNKTVTLDRSDPGFTITCDTAKYAVSIPATATANITPRQVNVTVTLSDHDLKTDGDGKCYYVFDGSEKRPAVAVTGSDDGGYSAALTGTDYGVDYKDNKNAGEATVTVTAKAGGNYTFEAKEVNFTIKNGAAVLTETPKAKELTYDGTKQDLVNVGSATGGTVVYSLTKEETEEKPYSETIPQGEDAGTYTVYYKVRGDGNHDDTAPGQVSVTIRPREITPIIALSGDGLVTGDDGTYSYVYDGSAKKPTVTVTGGVDANPIADTEYTVSYQDNTNAGTAKVIVSDNNGGNYIVNGTAYFEITKKAPEFTAPVGNTGLQYNGTAQELVKAGGSNDGTVVYSLNGGNWSTVIPTAAAVDTYTVSYKIQGDINHADTTPVDLTVKIDKNTVSSPAITLSPEGFRYNGIKQEPTVTVYDDAGLLIPKHEYAVAITGTNGNNGMVEVDTYTVTVTTPDSSNYVIAANNTRTFEIVPANQETISITGTKAQVRYGDAIQLGTTGGTGSGTVTWTVTDADGNEVNSDISATGLLTVKDVGGPIKVTATCAADNYNTVSATWEFSAAKKPVTAIVTADDKTYDGVTPATAVIHVTWKAGDLVGDDTIDTDALTGTFDNPNVGQNKTVTIAGGPITDPKYEVTIPGTTTASILAQAATVDAGLTANSLTYDASQSQELVTGGSVTGGILVYSMDRTNFSPSIPKGKDAGTYTVWFKAQGDGNHTDSAIGAVTVQIDKQEVTPQVKLTPSTAKYDGEEHTPTVTLWDGANNVIPASEYKVTYVTDGGKNWTDKGDYTVKIEDIDRGNYVVATTTAPFTISTTAQNPLEITNKPGLVYYGDTFTLSAVGGSGNAAVTWSVTEGTDVVEVDANGFVTIKGTGPAVITATKPGGDNYDTATATYPLNALRKPITAIVTADDKVFDNSDSATIHVTWKAGDLVSGDNIDTTPISGTFADANVGQNKPVTITGDPVSDTTSQKYFITIPRSATASIAKADTAAPAVTANALTYTGSAQTLVTGGDGNTRYSDSRDGVYSENVPTGTNAGTYTVWYKELGDDNHNDSAPQAVTVTISRKTLTTVDITLSGNDLVTADDGTYSYVYDGTEKKPTVTVKDGDAVVPASEYTVSYSNNKNVSTETEKGTVTITCGEGGNYTFAERKVTFTITSAAAQLTSSPQAKDLTYTGQAQELVTVGTAVGGHIEYLQTDGTYNKKIPEGTNAGTYTVTYKVVGDGNYEDSADIWTVSVTIKRKEVINPHITVNGEYNYVCTYDGKAKEPPVKLKDADTGEEISGTACESSYSDNINAGTATIHITSSPGGNYIINATKTFTIEKADVSDVTAPTGKTGLPYNGAAQALATAGSASGGTMAYALSEDGAYSPAIPTGTEVKEYTVWYKVQGDGNHNDTAAQPVTASIVVNEVEDPTVQVTPEAVTYNGKKQEPAVTIIAGDGHVIDGSEYTVKYEDAEGNAVIDPTNVGKYTLDIAGKENGNYTFSFTEKPTFEILPADQTPLTITGQRERVCYGDKFQLGTTGGSDGGTIAWKVEGGAPATIDNNGLLTITGVGSVKVTATSSAPGYSDKTATWSFHADKKPVTAVVTAESKTYDGETDAEVTATLQSSDLVSGDEKVTITLSGSFEDPNAGADKKVKIDSENPVFPEGKGSIYENYSITYPAITTASIFKADIDAAEVTAPTAKTDLVYTGLAQALVTAGSATGGTLEYSTDNITYSVSLPTGTDAGKYNVWYRVKGDQNHNDTAGTPLAAQVTIAQQEVERPTVELKPAGASYDGAVHQPTEVTVKDKNGRVIPDSEYTVTYGEGDWKTVGTYKVKITDAKADGNYDIARAEAEFEIRAAGQSTLSITNKPGTVYYGDTFTLSAVGGSGTGTILWEVTGPASISNNGLVKVAGSGSVTITATKLADGNYGESTDSWTFSAEKKPAKAIVTAKDKVFDSTDEAELVITWRDGDLVGNDTIDLESVLTGKFTTADVGDNKTVTISGDTPDSDKYAISFNRTTTASITPAAATVADVTAPDLTYNGQPQPLLSGGTATNGELAYSRDGANYTLAVPKEKNAGTYQVWYKAQGSGNYKDSPAVMVPVTIAPRTVGSPVIELSPEICDYDGSPKKPDVTVKDGSTVIPESEYTVRYSNNTNAGTATVTISNAEGGNYIVSGSATFTIKSGAATLTAAPQERELTYTGRAQALVTPGTAVNGHLEYSLDGGPYSTVIPKGTDVDEYFVYYKVVGDNGYGDTAPQLLIVTIGPKVVTPTIKVGGKASYSTPYTGDEQEPNVTVIVEGKTLTEGTDYHIVGYSDNTDPGTATVTVASTSDSNYQFYADATFVITKGKAVFSADPIPKTDLVYTGEAQALMTFAGFSEDGTVVCSLGGGTFYPFIPTGTEVGTYVVMVKVQGDEKHTDSDIKTYQVTIGKNVLTEAQLNVTLSANSLKYTGSELKPTVTVRDGEGNIISASEYSVSYSDNINVGTGKVTVTSTSKNYSFNKTVTFEIKDADAPGLKITGQPDTVYYGDTLKLGTTGGSGTVTWSVEDGNATSLGGGRFEVKGSGSITVKADDGSSSDTWTFYADPKPVTAIVSAADKTYDGGVNVTSWTVIVSGLVPGDTIDSSSFTVTGQFKDANAGTDKTVFITGLIIPEGISAKYAVSCPDNTTTATITPAPASVTNAPQKVTPLTYNGSAQALVTAGTASNGRMMYSLDGTNYGYDLPAGTGAKTYTVWYKAAATDKNHEDSEPDTVTGITISPNTDAPKVICTPDSFQFDGTAKAPTSIVVWDSANRTIPESEYTVTVPSVSAVGEYTVTVTDKPGGNYEFSSTTGGTFKIETGSQSSLTIVTELYDVNYGDSFRLSATGGSGDGAIVWSIAQEEGGEAPARISPNGVVTVTGTGGFTVQAYREAKDGYKQSNTVSLPFAAHAKPVTPVVTAEDDKPYDGKTDVKLTAKFRDGDLVKGDNLTLSVTGEFTSADVGTNKRVNITKHEANGTNVDKYDIRWPDSTTASIYKVDAQMENAPRPNLGTDNKGLTYKKDEAQELVTGGTTVGGIGTIVYSTSRDGAYSTAIPTGTDAGTYSVWYKVADSVNYTGIPAAELKVEIKKADPVVSSNPTATGSAGKKLSEITFDDGGSASVPGKFAWADGDTEAQEGVEYDVIFTPNDLANYNPVTIKVVAVGQAASSVPSSRPSGPSSIPSTPAQTATTVQNGTASTVVSTADGSRLVQSTKASQSQNAVIKPEITGDVTKTEVSIPSSTVRQLGSETDADLTVSSPIGDVTIPNGALGALSSAGGTVDVVTEQGEQGVTLAVTAGGRTVEDIPGGVTLAVPAEDAGPGTVAVLVHEDGTRETVRKSVVDDGVVSIPLSGSATVEIVDNSKDFDDVSPESWAADAVDFASAHELFGGTSATTFSPDLAMSRGMLATVLYRLEGNPELDLTEAFSDVNSDAWYAEGVAWAAESGIAGGYGDGQFGPNDDITREQFVVMLWRYAGRPEAGSRTLDFVDADQVSGFALEALCWAVENGILHGVGNGVLDPGGTATRAQAAQLLKNFMENT